MRAARAKRRAADDRKAIEACIRNIEETLEQIRELIVSDQIAHDEERIARLHAANARRAWFLFERGITYEPTRSPASPMT